MSDPGPPVPIEELLVHAQWVQRLARRLVRDEATALDVVQQTWQAGLRTPPTDRSRVRGWLARVVRNFARETHRKRGTREAREAAVARPEAVLVPPEELAERAEASRDVADAVTRLAEPYRSTILRRYYQGLSAQQIAAQEGVPVETVRTRIKRGIDAIRDDLRRRAGKNWAVALTPLLWRGGRRSAARWLRHAPRARWVRAAAVAIAAALFGGAAWIATRGDDSSSARAAGRGAPPDSAAASKAADVGRPAGPPESRTASAPPSVAPPSVAPTPGAPPPGPSTSSAASPSPDAVVRIEFEPSDATAEVAVKIVATPLRVGVARGREWARTFDVGASGGALELPRSSPIGTPLKAWDLRVEHPDLVPTHATVEVPATPEPDAAPRRLRRIAAGVLLGVVQSPRPAAECAPWVAAMGGELAAMEIVDQTAVAADGAFRLRLAPGRPHRIVVAARGARPAAFSATVPAREIRRAEVVALDEGGVVAGYAENFDGRPAVDAVIRLHGTSAGRPWPIGPYDVTIADASADWTQIETRTDAAGRFRAAGLRAGRYRASVFVPGLLSDRLNELTQEVSPGAAELRLAATAGAVVLRVLQDGATLPGAEVLVSGPSGGGTLKADAAGRATLLGRPGATYEVRLVVRGAAAKDPAPVAKRSVTTPELGAVRFETFETKSAAPPARLVLTLRGAGAPPAALGVALFAEGGDSATPPDVVRDVAAAGGVARLDGLAPGRYRLVVRPGGGWDDRRTFFLEASASVELRAGEDAAIELPMAAAGRLTLGARTPDGRWIAARCVVRGPDGGVVHVLAPRAGAWGTGEFGDVLSPSGPATLSPALAPGEYSVECSAAEGTGSARVTVRPGEAVETAVTLSPR